MESPNSSLRIAFIGHGKVGAALAIQLFRVGHQVVLAMNRPDSASFEALLAEQPGMRPLPIAQALETADLVVLATPFPVVESVLTPLTEMLAGKTLVDCTNPVGPGLTHGLESRQSGTQFIQRLLPSTRVVKAFTIYGYENLQDCRFPDANVLPAMMFCGDDAEAKGLVSRLIAQLGWQPLDVGGIEQALHLEHMTLLWIRLVRSQGYTPNLVWAALTR